MIKRHISDETRNKVMQCAINILRMHGSIVGNRCCQDWSGDEHESPVNIFTSDELDDISFNHEINNSNGEDYDPRFNGMSDEMTASFAIADMIEDIL